MKFNPKNKFVTNTGLDVDANGEWIKNQLIEILLADDNVAVGFGRSITPRAFRKMIGEKLLKLRDQYINKHLGNGIDLFDYLEEQRCSVEFGKETILRILSQSDCVGLRFTFCLNDDKEESIIVSGLSETVVNTTNVNTGETTSERVTSLLHKDVYQLGNLDKPNQVMPLDDERGVGKSYADFFRETDIDIEEFLGPGLIDVNEILTDAILNS